jgi:CPA2 family monovalent cation:H+ antiporter-2
MGSARGRDVMGILPDPRWPLLTSFPARPVRRRPAQSLAIAAVKAAAALAIILFLGRADARLVSTIARQRSSSVRAQRRWSRWARRSRLRVVAALGAFLAGMLIARRVPLPGRGTSANRDVLLGLFFIVVGTALDLRVVLDNLAWVAILLVAGL